jgi:outer membrane protein assembly factor BamD (BamD/ComL family)
MVRARRASEAVAQLEHLILTYPESALVPQARRTLDVARGAVPQT